MRKRSLFFVTPALVGVACASTHATHKPMEHRQGAFPFIGVPFLRGMGMGKVNPRYSNGNFRRKMRARFKARGDECGICKGRLGEIHYNEPSDSNHPLSFVIDEIKPISRYKEFGYESRRAAAEDISNLQPAHWICNAKKGAKVLKEKDYCHTIVNVSDGDW